MPSVVRITAPGMPSVVRLSSPAYPSVVRRDVAGIPGPAGQKGDKGDRGLPGRYGQLRVADTRVDPEDYFAAGIRQQLKFVPDPAQTQNFLRDPFTAVTWTDNRIVARPNAYGDWQDIIVNLLVVPQFGGGSIVADLDVGTGTPTQTDDYGLRGSGVAERATFRLGTQTLMGFMTNGAKVFLTGTVPFVIQSESIVYVPLSEGPGL